MVGIQKNTKKGSTNKHIGIRIWTEFPDAKPAEFYSDLKLFFQAFAKGGDIAELLKIHKKANEVLEALP